MTPTIQGIAIAFVILSVVFFVLQKIWPSVPGQRTFRKGFLTDVVYWGFTPFVTRVITPIAVGIALIPIALANGVDLKDLKTLAQGRGELAAQRNSEAREAATETKPAADGGEGRGSAGFYRGVQQASAGGSRVGGSFDSFA